MTLFSSHHRRMARGFTLVELLIVMTLFALASTLLMQNLFSVYHMREVIRFRKDLNFEASAILNGGVAGLIRSGFAINYPESQTQKSAGSSAEGLQTETDRISVFTDRAETQWFTLSREPYNAANDSSRLILSFSNGESFPLHTGDMVVEDFDVEVPKDPKNGGDRDLQPYVALYLRARKQYSLTRDDSKAMAHENARASYKTTFALRNTVPSSYK